MKTELNLKKTIKFTECLFFYAILGFTQPHSRPLNDPSKRFIQKNPESFKSEKPINITGSDKIHEKCDCNNKAIVNGIREPILYSFALDKLPVRKIYKEPGITLFKR